MTTDFQPHRRQFVICATSIDLPDWSSVTLLPGVILSHHKELAVADRAGTLYLGRPLLGGEAGRFVAIAGGRLRLDAAGLLAVYHGRARADGGLLVTSSPALGRQLCRTGPEPRRLRRDGMNWYPSPGAPALGLSRLLRDQVLDLRTGAVTAQDRRILALPDRAPEVLAEHLVATVRDLPEARLRLALTAGLDSRLLFAALLESGRRFETFTQDLGPGARGDLDGAAALSRRHGIRFVAVPQGAHRPDAAAAFAAHTDGACLDADSTVLLPHGQYDFLTGEDVVIRGGGFELGRRHFKRRLLQGEAAFPPPEVIVRRFGGDPAAEASAVAALAAWLDWRRAHPDGLDLVDSFFLDQRLGGWLAAVEQGLDALPFTSVQPGNSALVFAALVSTASDARRLKGHVQRQAIRYLDPGLLAQPVNPHLARRLPLRRRLRGLGGDLLRAVGLRPA